MRVDNVQDEAVLDRVDDHTGVDGRRWDDQLIAAEMLNELDPIARWVFLLHILEDRPFHDVARALRLTQAGRLPERTGGRWTSYGCGPAGLARSGRCARQRVRPASRPIERLVEVLHEGTTLHGRSAGLGDRLRAGQPLRGALRPADGAAGDARLHRRAVCRKPGRLGVRDRRADAGCICVASLRRPSGPSRTSRSTRTSWIADLSAAGLLRHRRRSGQLPARGSGPAVLAGSGVGERRLELAQLLAHRLDLPGEGH